MRRERKPNHAAAVLLVAIALFVLATPALMYHLGYQAGATRANFAMELTLEEAKASSDLAAQAFDEANHWRRQAKEASATIAELEAAQAVAE